MIEDIVSTTFESFDFSFCIAVNVLTYLIIKLIDDCNGQQTTSSWTKRLVMLCCVILVGVFYYITETNLRLIMNSAILAPVFWSWIGKPICKKLDIDYNKDCSV